MKHRAFTLLELLVTITLIATLAALLLPSLAKARTLARSTVCASNLHQLGIATTTYLDAYDGHFFRYYADQSFPTSGRQWWFGFEKSGPATTPNRPLEKSLAPLAPYTANLATLLQCPDFPYADSNFFQKFNQRAASYGYNIKLGPAVGDTASRNQFADRPATVFTFADGIHFDFGPTFNEAHYILYTPNAATPSGYAHFRHRLSGTWQSQVLYLDAHVAPQGILPPTARPIAGMPTANLHSPTNTNSIYGF